MELEEWLSMAENGYLLKGIVHYLTKFHVSTFNT